MTNFTQREVTNLTGRYRTSFVFAEKLKQKAKKTQKEKTNLLDGTSPFGESSQAEPHVQIEAENINPDGFFGFLHTLSTTDQR